MGRQSRSSFTYDAFGYGSDSSLHNPDAYQTEGERFFGATPTKALFANSKTGKTKSISSPQDLNRVIRAVDEEENDEEDDKEEEEDDDDNKEDDWRNTTTANDEANISLQTNCSSNILLWVCFCTRSGSPSPIDDLSQFTRKRERSGCSCDPLAAVLLPCCCSLATQSY